MNALRCWPEANAAIFMPITLSGSLDFRGRWKYNTDSPLCKGWEPYLPTRVSDPELHCIRDFLLVFQNEVVVVLMTVLHLSDNNSNIQHLAIQIYDSLIFMCGQNIRSFFPVFVRSDVLRLP